MAYWWVNQGRTFQLESDGGFFWAPIPVERQNKNWSAVSQLEPGDVVFSHVRREIRAISTVTSRAVERRQPHQPSSERAWLRTGYYVRAKYVHLDKRVSVAANKDILEPLMPDHLAPMNSAWNADQGYMYSIPPELGQAILRLADMSLNDSVEYLVTAIQNSSLASTEKEALITARRGQGRFRDALMRLWDGQCAVTSMAIPQLLKASHIKPWADSNHVERLDEFNGLLLNPALDAAFDRGYITFAHDTGKLHVSSQLDMKDACKIGIQSDMQLVRVPEEAAWYLQYHQAHIFRN